MPDPNEVTAEMRAERDRELAQMVDDHRWFRWDSPTQSFVISPHAPADVVARYVR